MSNDTRTCRNDTTCKAYDPATRAAHPVEDPDTLCHACLDTSRRDVHTLLYDYLDLAQLHETSLSQALAEKVAGGGDKPMLIVAAVEALQAEIVHVTTTWEYEVRVAANLADPTTHAPVATWHTTISRPTPLAKVRPGAAVQRATTVLTAHIRTLSRLPATAVCPTGAEDPPTDLTGWQAVQHLVGLHKHARAMLGRTTRTFWIPGVCWACDSRPVPGVDGPLYRSEPRRHLDPLQVHCAHCSATRPYADYEHYQQHLKWPASLDTTMSALPGGAR